MALHSPQPAPSRDTVAEISHYFSQELVEIEGILSGLAQSDSRLIGDVSKYICLSNGKKLRPMLNLLATRAFSPGGDVSVQIATAMELIHVATLLHDDVIDKAGVRRGKASVNARWGDDVAILMADYLYASAFELVLHELVPSALQLICKVTRRMCEGEMFQIERRGGWLKPEDYIHICTCKTAFLFSACTGLGGEKAGLPLDQSGQLAAFGLNFGLAFQITDDTLDYTADHQHWGKAVGGDLAAGKQTLPLILTLQAAGSAERGDLERALAPGGNPAVVLEAIERHQSIERSLEIARDFAVKAIGSLDGLHIYDQTAYEFLTALPEYVIERRY